MCGCNITNSTATNNGLADTKKIAINFCYYI